MSERERRAFNRGIETAHRIALLYAEELWRMNHDTLLADPILMGTVTRQTIERDAKISEKLASEGYGRACSAHTAQNIADAIKGAKKK